MPSSEPICLRPTRLVRFPSFNQLLAQEYVELNQSGDKDVDWIANKLFLENCWPVIDRNHTELEMGDFDDAFGEDPGRWMNEYKRKAVKPYKIRLHENLVRRIDYLDVAMVVHHRLAHSRKDWLITD